MAQVICLPAGINGRYASPGRALVDQLPIFDDSVAVANMVLEESIGMYIIAVEKLEFAAIAMPLEGGIAIKTSVLK